MNGKAALAEAAVVAAAVDAVACAAQCIHVATAKRVKQRI